MIVNFVRALGLDRVGLVGHDSGGTIARIAAAQLQETAAVVAMTNTELPNHRIPLIGLLRAFARLPGSPTIFRMLLGSSRFVRSRLGFAGTFEDLDLLEGEFKEALLLPLLANIEGALDALVAADLSVVFRLEELHARIKAPAICVWGDQDPFFPLAGAREMVRAWHGDATLHVLPGKKLLVHEEAPQDVARLFAPVLEGALRPKLSRVAAH